MSRWPAGGVSLGVLALATVGLTVMLLSPKGDVHAEAGAVIADPALDELLFRLEKETALSAPGWAIYESDPVVFFRGASETLNCERSGATFLYWPQNSTPQFDLTPRDELKQHSAMRAALSNGSLVQGEYYWGFCREDGSWESLVPETERSLPPDQQTAELFPVTVRDGEETSVFDSVTEPRCFLRLRLKVCWSGPVEGLEVLPTVVPGVVEFVENAAQ